MPTYRDEAVVLRTHKLGEADRIITMLSKGRGKIRAVAKGVRRTTSKFGARLEPFSHVDLQLATGRSLDVITQAVTLHPYGQNLGQDYPRYTAGQVILETADRIVAEEGEPSRAQYQLLVGALHALAVGTARGRRPPAMVLDAYLLRAVAVAGYAPSFAECARCGAPGPHEGFSATAGGAVCIRCRPPGTARPPIGTLPYLAALLAGDWAATENLDAAIVQQGSELVTSFASWHLDRSLRSLKHLDRDDENGA